MHTPSTQVETPLSCSGSDTQFPEFASFFTRLISLLIDIIIVRLSTFIIFLPLNGLFTALSTGNIIGYSGDGAHVLKCFALGVLIPFFVSVLYFVTFWSTSGETIGKKIFGLKVVGLDGKPLKLKNALLRYIGYAISGFLFIGFIWAAFDEKSQGWHDRLATSYVVKV